MNFAMSVLAEIRHFNLIFILRRKILLLWFTKLSYIPTLPSVLNFDCCYWLLHCCNNSNLRIDGSHILLVHKCKKAFFSTANLVNSLFLYSILAPDGRTLLSLNLNFCLATCHYDLLIHPKYLAGEQ